MQGRCNMEEKIIEVTNPKTGKVNLSEIVRERVEIIKEDKAENQP